jgi:hypothetical protein
MYSTVVMLSNSTINFGINTLVNPITDKISFELIAPANDMVTCRLVDAYGRVVKRQNQNATRGLNAIEIPDLAALPPGLYALQVQYSGTQVCKPVLKVVAK